MKRLMIFNLYAHQQGTLQTRGDRVSVCPISVETSDFFTTSVSACPGSRDAAGGHVSQLDLDHRRESYADFFLGRPLLAAGAARLAAQRFFMAADSFSRPSGVTPPPALARGASTLSSKPIPSTARNAVRAISMAFLCCSRLEIMPFRPPGVSATLAGALGSWVL
jgi:hypothetical protein